jgi:hypothetical protein
MTRHFLLPALLLLAACGSKPTQPEARQSGNAATPIAKPTTPPSKEEIAGAKDAAGTLRDYYALIGKGDYEGAIRLRSDRRTGAKRLADNFKAYETYNAQVGAPGRPVRGGDWLYVRVQVMITGSFKGGKGFGSAGTVTLRRSTAADAAPADSEWHVYTG